jgi:hypothetical protein
MYKNLILMATRHRHTKSELYVQQRADIVKVLFEIMGINKYNRVVFYDELKDAEKQEKIIELSSRVKICFRSSDWGFFRDNVNDGVSSLIRKIMKDMGVTMYPLVVMDGTRSRKTIKTGFYISSDDISKFL